MISVVKYACFFVQIFEVKLYNWHSLSRQITRIISCKFLQSSMLLLNILARNMLKVSELRSSFIMHDLPQRKM